MDWVSESAVGDQVNDDLGYLPGAHFLNEVPTTGDSDMVLISCSRDPLTEKPVQTRGYRIVIAERTDKGFIEGLETRDNPKADWYLWADAKPDGSPPQ